MNAQTPQTVVVEVKKEEKVFSRRHKNKIILHSSRSDGQLVDRSLIFGSVLLLEILICYLHRGGKQR